MAAPSMIPNDVFEEIESKNKAMVRNRGIKKHAVGKKGVEKRGMEKDKERCFLIISRLSRFSSSWMHSKLSQHLIHSPSLPVDRGRLRWERSFLIDQTQTLSHSLTLSPQSAEEEEEDEYDDIASVGSDPDPDEGDEPEAPEEEEDLPADIEETL